MFGGSWWCFLSFCVSFWWWLDASYWSWMMSEGIFLPRKLGKRIEMISWLSGQLSASRKHWCARKSHGVPCRKMQRLAVPSRCCRSEEVSSSNSWGQGLHQHLIFSNSSELSHRTSRRSGSKSRTSLAKSDAQNVPTFPCCFLSATERDPAEWNIRPRLRHLQRREEFERKFQGFSKGQNVSWRNYNSVGKQHLGLSS